MEVIAFFNDLGVILNSKVTFNLPAKSIMCRARHTLGFIRRWSKDFDHSYLTKGIYLHFVGNAHACIDYLAS